jgi:hypothetical protein
MTTIQSSTRWSGAAKAATVALLAVWAGFAYLVGSSGFVTAPETQAFRPVVLTAIVPVAIFALAYGLSARLRGLVHALDIHTLTGLQHWRVVGFAFLLLYAFDVLPALFAFAAGVGDVLIGLAAPGVVARLARDPSFARSRRFAAYHALGLLDFAVAVATASLASGAFPALVSGPVTSAPMEVWPLVLFPSLIVPIFIILHLVVFLQVRALRRANDIPSAVAWQSA